MIKYLEKREDFNYEITENILIIKVKKSDNYNQSYGLKNTFNEFIKIILFTQGYKEVIKNLLDTFSETQKYCKNIEEYMNIILSEEKIKMEISERNRKYAKNVNINFLI